MHEVEVPAHLQDLPFLRPVYDHPQFLVRNVWRRFGGWWDGEPDHLLPAPRAQVATEWVDLVGGVAPVLERAEALADDGDLGLACHLVEFAVLAEPDSTEAHRCGPRSTAVAPPSRSRRWPATSSTTPRRPAAKVDEISPDRADRRPTPPPALRIWVIRGRRSTR